MDARARGYYIYHNYGAEMVMRGHKRQLFDKTWTIGVQCKWLSKMKIPRKIACFCNLGIVVSIIPIGIIPDTRFFWGFSSDCNRIFRRVIHGRTPFNLYYLR